MKDPQKELDCPHCGDELPVFRPYAIDAYLKEAGWKVLYSWHGWLIYAKTRGDTPVELHVPQIFDAIDYPRCYWYLITDLRKIEGRKLKLITNDITAAENRLLERNPSAGLETPVGNYTKMEWLALQKEINED